MSNASYRNSYWETDSILRPADVLIVGGGLTGLQTAIGLKEKQPDLDVLLVERAPFSRGASTRNAGFACFGSPTEILDDLEHGTSTEVWDTVERRYAGIRKLEAQSGPVCSYRRHGGYELFYPGQSAYERVIEQLPDLNAAFARIAPGRPAWVTVGGHPNIRKECRLVYCSLEGQLHPGQLVSALMQRAGDLKIRLLYGVEVTGVGEDQGSYYAEINHASAPLRAARLILATNAFTKALVPDLPIQPARNQVLITEPIPGLQIRGCFHHERGYVYFRNVGEDRLLIGGARQLAGPVSETTEFGENQAILAELTDYLRRALDLDPSVLKISQSWSGIIAQGGKSPIVRKLDDGIIVAARLSGMGVALSARVAEEAVALALC